MGSPNQKLSCKNTRRGWGEKKGKAKPQNNIGFKILLISANGLKSNKDSVDLIISIFNWYFT